MQGPGLALRFQWLEEGWPLASNHWKPCMRSGGGLLCCRSKGRGLVATRFQDPLR